MNPVSFFILAGGYGKRAEPLSFIKPKPAFPLHGTPLIRILLDQLKTAGVSEGFINLHHQPESLRRSIGEPHGLSIRYLDEAVLSGSRILSRAAPHMREFLWVMNGDVFMEIPKIPIARMVAQTAADGADGALLLRENHDPAYPTILTDDGFYRVRAPHPGRPAPMYTGVALFHRSVVEAIHHTSFFTTLDEGDFKIKTFLYNGLWLDIGSPRLYFQANTAYKEHIGVKPLQNSLSPSVRVSNSSNVSNSIIWENVEINGGSRVSGCVVTEGLSLHGVDASNKIIYQQNGEILIEDL